MAGGLSGALLRQAMPVLDICGWGKLMRVAYVDCLSKRPERTRHLQSAARLAKPASRAKLRGQGSEW
eukprot:158178-Alexandrium_andersonii.AAC.1